VVLGRTRGVIATRRYFTARPGRAPIHLIEESGQALRQGTVDRRETLCRVPVRPDSLVSMRDETIGSFLTRLAARSAVPGGGATGALHAAQAAALLAMVARFSDGARYDAETVGRVRAAADGLADESVGLAVADSAAFEKVIAAYGLPRDTPQATVARSAAIADAMAVAARPPADLMAASVRLVGLAEELLPVANKNVISDIAAAAAAVSAAAVTAAVNIEANLPGIKDPALAEELSATAALADGVTDRADRVIAAIREEIRQ
jgi:methenyltetrahydrofolate cyclohydrolase